MKIWMRVFRVDSIEKEQVGHLRRFLEERERELAGCMCHAFAMEETPDTISEAFRLIERRIVQKGVWEGVIDTLNVCLWDYLSVLEGGAAELFQCVDRLLLCDWTEDHFEAILGLTETLKGHQRRLKHTIDRLEDLLWEYRWIADPEAPSNWLVRKLVRASQCLLDTDLGRNLHKSQRFLQSRYATFADRYIEYARLNRGAEEALEKIREFCIFQSLDRRAQESYLFIYRLLRIWEQDIQGKSLLLEDLGRAMKCGQSPESVLAYLQIYYRFLQDDLFSTSIQIKQGMNIAQSVERMRAAQREHHQLERFVARFREFLLRTDPNPYVRSRWGFSEWVMGPEPEVSKKLRRLEFDLEAFDKIYELFFGALSRNREADQTALVEIKRILHQMAQPMATRHAMQGYAENLVASLRDLDELGSARMEIIDEADEVLLMAMEGDWRYVTLWGLNDFHEIVKIHRQLLERSRPTVAMGIPGSLDNQMQQIVRWAHQGHLSKHLAELDALVMDWQEYLTSKSRDDRHFEARYQLGRFFYDLQYFGSEGQLVRQAFDRLVFS